MVLNSRYEPSKSASCAIILCFALATGCRTIEGGSLPKAVVDTEQYERSIAILARLLSPENGFVPFEHTANGCQDRALFMSMALAADGIPSTAVFVYAKVGGRPLTHPDGVTKWGFHVAPMIKVGLEGTEMIVDPAVSEGSHLTYQEWLSRIGANETEFNVSRIHGSIYWGIMSASTTRNDPIIMSFAEMQPFKLREIASVCASLMGALSQAPTFGEGYRVRQRRMLDETSRLIKALVSRGKLVDDMPYTRMCTIGNLAEGVLGLDGDTGEVISILP